MKKTRRRLLDPAWSEALLSVPSEHSKDKTVSEVLTQLRSAYEASVQEAIKVIGSHPFAEVIASEAAKRVGWRGEATLEVSEEDGHVYLVVAGKSSSQSSDTRDWQSDLPSIQVLREQAVALGIDPEPFGRSKRKLLAEIKAKQESKPKLKRGFTKTSVAVNTRIINKPDTERSLANMIGTAETLNLDDI